MRTALICLTSLVALSAQAAELHVAAEKEHVIDTAFVQLERLVLEDGATLRVAPGIEALVLQADNAWIGEGVRLIASGVPGSPGADGADGESPGGCNDGGAGEPGGTGENGANGVDLDLRLGLHQFGSLLLESRGSNGGLGGQGGRGGNGGSSERCAGGTGGNGGQGGTGGAGGRGGEVRVSYWSLSKEGMLPVSNFGPGLQIVNDGGQGARGGEGGEPGAGGIGELVKRPTGIKLFRNPGEDGKPGKPGAHGAPGAPGRFIVEPLAGPRS